MKTFTKAVALLMSILVPASDASAQCFVLSLQHRLETKQVKYFFMDDWPEPIADPPNAQPTTVKGCIVKGFMLWHGRRGITIQAVSSVGASNVTVSKAGNTERVFGDWNPVSWVFQIPYVNKLRASAIRFNDNIGLRSGWSCVRIQKAAAHEMGHHLGFGHPPDSFPPGSTVMFQTRPESTIDDLDFRLSFGPSCGDDEALKFLEEL